MDTEPPLPVAISYVGSKYLIFDINVVTWLRRAHNICGVMSGTLPQSPSQNLFLGLPVQIMPEEAQLLVEKGVGFIFDDVNAHDQALKDVDISRQTEYVTKLRRKGEQVSISREEEKDEAKRLSLKQPKGKAKLKVKKQPPEPSKRLLDQEAPTNEPSVVQAVEEDADTSLFDSASTPKPRPSTPTTQLQPHGIVPTTSDLWLPTASTHPSSSESRALLPNVPPSYALYKHLNSKSYFMTPGLRFGCQYCVYPGDPLRFHSHFLAVGTQWNEEIDLMDIVGGGRLGTGVKKGFLIGGMEPPKAGQEGQEEGRVRTFSIEWAVM